MTAIHSTTHSTNRSPTDTVTGSTTVHRRIPTRAGTTSRPEELTADRVTKSLLGYGIIAGPIYVVTSLIEAATRDGFDISRHAWSQLAQGGPGWVHVVNLALTGLMVIAFAVGLHRALVDGPAARWAPLLFGVFGLGMVVSAAFRADAGGGFPPGSPDTTTLSTTGTVHFAAGGIGFTALAVGLVIYGRRLSREGFTGLAVASWVIGPLYLLSFLLMAGQLTGVLPFVAAVIAGFTLLSVLAVHRYRHMPNTDTRPCR